MHNRLKEFRKSLGLSQVDVAGALGFTQGYYSGLESGKRPLTDMMIAFISSVFKVREEWLKTGEGDMMEYDEKAAEFEEIYNKLEPHNRKLIDDLLKQLLRAQIQEEKEKRTK